MKDEAARQLGIFEVINSALAQVGVTSPGQKAESRSFPIRTICPRFSPWTDPIGSLETWLTGIDNYCHLQKVVDPMDQKRVMYSSIEVNAQCYLGQDLLLDSNFANKLLYKEYAEQVRLVFLPPEESILWKNDYRNYKQSRGVTVVDYIQRKAMLFRLGYRQTADSPHFIEEAILHIFHHNVRREVYRTDLQTFSALITACQKAVGLIRQIEAPPTPLLGPPPRRPVARCRRSARTPTTSKTSMTLATSPVNRSPSNRLSTAS